MADLAKLVIALEANQSKLIRGLEDTNKRIRDFQRRTDGTLKNVDKSFNRVSRGVNVLAGALIALGAKRVIGGIIEISDAYKSVEGRLRIVTKSSEELASVQENLFKVAQRSRTGFEETANVYARIARNAGQLGASQKEVLQVTESISKAALVAGATFQEASSGILQLSQAFSSGQLQGDELRSVLENIPRVAQAIADGLGVTIGELRKLSKEGELSAERVFNALLSQREAIEREFALLPVTVSQSLQVLRNEFRKAIAEADLSKITAQIAELTRIISDPSVISGLTEVANALLKIAEYGIRAASAYGRFLEKFSNSPENLQNRVGVLNRLIGQQGGEGSVSAAALIKERDQLLRDLSPGIQLTENAQADINHLNALNDAVGDLARGFFDVEKAAKKASITEILSQNIADIEASSARITATLNAEQAELERNYAQNLVSFAQFFDRRAEIQQAAIDQEIKARQASLALAQAQEQEKIKAGKSAESIIRTQGKIIGEISALEIQRGEIAKQAAYESAQANRELVESLESVAIQIQRIQGDTVGAALADFDSSNRKLIERLFVEGNRAGIEQVKTLRSLVESQEKFNRLQQEALDIKEDLAIFEERIRNSQEVGAKTEFEALKEIGQARERSLDQLQSIYESQRRIAEEAGNPELIRNVKRFSAELDTLATQTDLVGQKFRGIFKDSFTDFFESLADGTKGFHEVFTDLLNDIHRQITRLAAQNLAEQLFGASGGDGGGSGLFGKIIGGIFGAFGGGGSTAVASDLGHVQGFASGGRYSANEPRIVGEFGPELDIPDHSGRIIPNNELGGGMSVTIQQSITVADGGTLSPRSRHQIANETAIGVQRALARHNGR